MSEEDGKKTSGWPSPKALGAAVALVLSIAVSSIGLWEFVSKPAPQLEATLEYAKLEQPPGFYNLVPLANSYLDVDKLKEQAGFDDSFNDRESFSHEEVLRALERVHKRGTLDADDPVVSLLRHARGYYKIQVVNSGNTTITAAKLTFDDGMIAEIDRPGDNDSVETVTEEVQIGKLQKGESASAVVWLKSPPTEWDAERVTLTSDEELGSVDVLVPTRAAVRSLKFYRDLIVAIVCGVLISLLFVVPSYLLSRAEGSYSKQMKSEKVAVDERKQLDAPSDHSSPDKPPVPIEIKSAKSSPEWP